jgi:DNA-binding transcriptional LysR family regulator
MDVDLSEIRSFLVLAGALHFGRASEQLFLSQPALSKKIRRLEDKVEARLFTRTRRKVALTEAGRVLLTKAGKLLQDAESALATARAAAEGRAGTLRVGFGIASVSEIVPRTILSFRKSYPDVELQMRDMSTPSQTAALLDGTLDVGILRLPVTFPELMSAPLFCEHLVLAAPANIRFTKRDRLGDFRDQPFIFLPRSVSETFHDHVLNLCWRAGFTPRIVQEAGEMFTILNLVRAGLGISLVPSSAVRMKVPGVHFHDVRMKDAMWRIGIAWNRNSERRVLVSRLANVITAVVERRARSGEL